MSDEALMGELRSALADGQSVGVFGGVAKLLGKGDASQQVLDYLEPQFARWPEEIDRKAPWEWVTRACRGWKAPALRLATSVDASWHTFKAKHAVAFADSPDVRNIRKFRTDPKSTTEIGDEGVIAFAQSPHLESLVELEIWSNTASNEAVVVLLSSANLPSLRRLTLRGPRGTREAVDALFESPLFDTLTGLNFSNSSYSRDVTEDDKARISARLKANYERLEAERAG